MLSWELDLKWLKKDFEGVLQFLTEHHDSLPAKPYLRIKADSYRIRCLVKLERTEEAVKEAIKTLVANGQRAYSDSVPKEAKSILMRNRRARVTPAVAAAKVDQAIARLRERKEIKAPPTRQHDWVVMSQPPPPAKPA